MFGKRADGKKVKNIDIMFKFIPRLMKDRNDAFVFYKQSINYEKLHEYRAKKKEEGINLNTIDIIFAATARIMAERPKLNRFVANQQIYARNGIIFSMISKSSKGDDGEENIIKIEFNGTENIFEVHEKLQSAIAEVKTKDTNKNDIDKTINKFSKLPAFVFNFIVNACRFSDKHGLIPKKLIDISPFHSSAFVSDLGSINGEAVFHHLYNFGTTSIFVTMGKKVNRSVVKDNKICTQRCINIIFTLDERICDGYYYISSLKKWTQYVNNPELLENKLEKRIIDPEL